MRRAIVAAAALLAACATAPSTTGPTLPPELQRVFDDYTAGWVSKNGNALAGLFTPDRVVVPNMCPPTTRRADLEACYANSGNSLHLRALDHRIDGSLAYIIGEYAGGPNDPPAGKFVLTLTKDASGRWLIVADMDREYRRQAPPQ